jgi:predicted nucleic acid-binding protein
MIVVADTTPVNYLILIGEIDLLAKLYGQVVIPRAVHEELMRSRAPASVKAWIASPPPWLEILSPVPVSGLVLADLDVGEQEAIALALQLSADLLIIDELLGRREAERRGLPVIGTIGILRDAADGGLVDLRASIGRLRQTSFHISPAILASLLDDRG